MSGQEFPDLEFVTWQSRRRDECPPDLRFLHYNDVYHIEYVAIRKSIPGMSTYFNGNLLIR